MRFAQRVTSSASCLCDGTMGICGDSPRVGKRVRTRRALIVTSKVFFMGTATILEVQRSVGQPALMAPSHKMSLSCCLCVSLSLEGLPEPCFRTRHVISSLL